jgi:outer membrane protein TolC
MQAHALQDRPDIREARLKAEQATLDLRMKRTERIPDVSLALSYTSNVNMDILPRNLSSVGVQVKWEPFDWGRKNRELSSKQHTVQQAKLGVRDAEDRAVIEINARYRTLNEARARLDVARLAETSAHEKLRVKTNQFQIQSALLADVLHQKVELADSTDRYQQALLAFWTAKVDFDQAVGEDVIP